jgi:hypothetical protein
MYRSQRFSPPSWVTRLVAVAGLAVVLCAAAAPAQDIVRVEEDWELVLGEPDSNIVGPQVSTVMSPFGNIDSTYFTLEMNHRSAPTWQPGGITIHRWDGECRMDSYDRDDRSVMSTTGEVVTWTKVLKVNDGVLTYKIIDGASTTWGAFGYTGNLKLSTPWTDGNLNSYSPDVSVGESGVAYAGNRVQTLRIKQIRYKLSDDTWVTDNTVRTVHQLVE